MLKARLKYKHFFAGLYLLSYLFFMGIQMVHTHSASIILSSVDVVTGTSESIFDNDDGVCLVHHLNNTVSFYFYSSYGVLPAVSLLCTLCFTSGSSKIQSPQLEYFSSRAPPLDSDYLC